MGGSAPCCGNKLDAEPSKVQAVYSTQDESAAEAKTREADGNQKADAGSAEAPPGDGDGGDGGESPPSGQTSLPSLGGTVAGGRSSANSVGNLERKLSSDSGPPPRTPSSARAVVHTKDEIIIAEETSTESLAKLRAEATFNGLREDYSDEQFQKLKEVVGSIPLSKERTRVILEDTEGHRLTCEQLSVILRLLAMDSLKEQVLIARYAHLVDKDSFRTAVVNQVTRSESMQASLVRKLTTKLAQ